METIPGNLILAALAARERLGDDARGAAAADAVPGRLGSETQMAGAARRAIFVDALLSAMHARLEALKNVTK